MGPSNFNRRRHLLFAIAALGHGPLLVYVQRGPTATSEALAQTTALCYVALLAWLAFDRLDTKSGVTLLPARAKMLAPLFLAWLGWSVIELSAVSAAPLADIVTLNRWLNGPYVDFGLAHPTLDLGWLILTMAAAGLAEELVYRGFLLRALEGYWDPRVALVAQALVFEAVHLVVYDAGYSGAWRLVSGLLYGVAFQQTRSVAVPAFMHAASNVLLSVAFWALAG